MASRLDRNAGASEEGKNSNNKSDGVELDHVERVQHYGNIYSRRNRGNNGGLTSPIMYVMCAEFILDTPCGGYTAD